jgi:integrase
MKGGEEHRVHLSGRVLEILEAMQALKQPYVFPNPRLDRGPLSNMAMLTVLRRMDADKRTTVHGLARSTFSTWANETGAARPDVIEACLAHRENDRIRAAYNRARFNADRAALLESWAEFLTGGEATGNVVEFRTARAA